MSGDNAGGPGPLPPRWLNCPRKAIELIGGKFMAFKTPLSSDFNSQVSPACRFTPAMLLSAVKQYKLKLGLWIDLTKTSRFYPRTEIEQNDIAYLKLQCSGHGEAPTLEQTRTFVDVCTRFISKNPLGSIAVHCTHGFNRTGFLICAFLVEQFDYSVDAAVDIFARARPPGIYKGDYLRELFRRYGDEADCVSPPELPDWCFDESPAEEDSGNHHSQGDSLKSGRQKGGGKKKTGQFMEGVPGVTNIACQPRLGQLQRRFQQLCDWQSNGFPGCQPVSMSQENLGFLQDVRYKVSWKADGTRYMMLIDGEDQIYFADRDNAVYRVQNLSFPYRKNLNEHLADTLLDGEMVIDKINGKSYPRFLVYDIVRFRNMEVGKTNLETRLMCIRKEIIETRKHAMESGRILREKEPFSVRAKEFWDLNQASSLLSEKFKRSLAHEPDGLIFQPFDDGYVCGRCDIVLKWKPPSHNSVDFRLKVTCESGEGLVPKKIGLLYVGSLTTPFAQIKITKELKKYDGKIIECRWDGCRWVFMRERTDKSFPNALSTAEAVCSTIRNPVTEEILLDFIQHKVKRRPDHELMPPPPAKR